MTARKRRRRSALDRAQPYGNEQKRWRAFLLSTFRDGQPCPRCGLPMRHWQRLHAGHVVARTLGGMNGPRRLEHASCNESAGSRLQQAMRTSKAARIAAVKAAQANMGGKPKW